MKKTKCLGIFLFPVVFVFIAGCSHAKFGNMGGGGGNTAPMILTFHDTPPAGITVTSFEITVTGAALKPGNVSLLQSPQTIELTQLQTNSVFLSTTNVPLATYTGLTITYANPKFTFLNDTGVQVTAGGQTCNAGASCVVTMPTISAQTLALSGASFPSVIVGASNQTLLEVDVNLNNIIQPSFALDFSKSGAVTVTQLTGVASGSAVIGNFNVAGQVSSVTATPTPQFKLITSTGQTLTINANAASFQFARANCTANNFTCLATGQIVDANVNIFSNSTLGATEVVFDDASGTQQVSGAIVSENTSPPTSFQMIVHNTIPPVASLTPGTPVTVNIGSGASFVVNNGLFTVPANLTTGQSLNFASTSDLIVGQEVEVRVKSGTTIANGPPPSFTTDRFALEQTQIEANASSISQQTSIFVLSPLPPLFSPTNQLQVFIITAGQSSGTIFQNLTPLNLGGLTVGQPVTAGGFLFNTTGSPTIVATTVRGEVPGT